MGMEGPGAYVPSEDEMKKAKELASEQPQESYNMPYLGPDAYKPSEKEIQEAEGMMDEKQKIQSEARAEGVHMAQRDEEISMRGPVEREREDYEKKIGLLKDALMEAELSAQLRGKQIGILYDALRKFKAMPEFSNLNIDDVFNEVGSRELTDAEKDFTLNQDLSSRFNVNM